MNDLDHPIFSESLRRIRHWLGDTGLRGTERDVLERLVHSSGDPSLAPDLRFSPGAGERGALALAAGAPILTDTAMAAAAVSPMARRTFANPVHSVLAWAPETAPVDGTRTAEGMAKVDKVAGCYLISGGYDLLVVVEGASLREVASFVSEKLSTLEPVISTATHFRLKTYKENGALLVGDTAEDRLAVSP